MERRGGRGTHPRRHRQRRTPRGIGTAVPRLPRRGERAPRRILPRCAPGRHVREELPRLQRIGPVSQTARHVPGGLGGLRRRLGHLRQIARGESLQCVRGQAEILHPRCPTQQRNGGDGRAERLPHKAPRRRRGVERHGRGVPRRLRFQGGGVLLRGGDTGVSPRFRRPRAVRRGVLHVGGGGPCQIGTEAPGAGDTARSQQFTGVVRPVGRRGGIFGRGGTIAQGEKGGGGGGRGGGQGIDQVWGRKVDDGVQGEGDGGDCGKIVEGDVGAVMRALTIVKQCDQKWK
mmetsp:Transcript_12513/g.21667  ORF Transcript_12513/g.21667 Transcript_12513/m.21667 type:complete len:288 (-) Transcript_12513:24-887(-)